MTDTRTCNTCRGSGYLTWTQPDRAPQTKECYNCSGNGYITIFPPEAFIEKSHPERGKSLADRMKEQYGDSLVR